MIITSKDRVLFYGDSITDCGRNRDQLGDFGKGYAFITASKLFASVGGPDFSCWNKGISGNRIYDLESRFEPEVLPLKPTVVSILIGVNDSWHAYKSNKPSPHPDFEASYRRLLDRLTKELKAKVILMEPFVLPTSAEIRAWRADLDIRIHLVQDLAREYKATFIPLDGIFSAAAASVGSMEHWLYDGVHPSMAGHSLISQQWLSAVTLQR